VGRVTRPDVVAFKSGNYVHGVLVAYSELDLCGAALSIVDDQLDQVSTGAFFAGLCYQGVEAGAYLAGAEVARGCDELDPEGHGSLASVAEFEEGTAWGRVVVNKVENAHLV